MNEHKSVCIVTEWPLPEGWSRNTLERALLREGIHANQITWLSLLDKRPYDGSVAKAPPSELEAGRISLRNNLGRICPNATLLLGGYLARDLAGCEGIDKWQSSVVVRENRKYVICYPMERVAQDLSLQLWLSVCAKKLAAEASSPLLERKPHVHLLNPPLEEALAYLRGPVAGARMVSVDIETGRGQINTVGFAISPTEAIAINVLPDRLGDESFSALWRAIADILESDQPKILQNFIYEHLFFSRYGIALRGVTHDTMICQKFLWPEFEMGLDAVGRMYSEMSYWKDDGKSWNNIRDWEAHYEYNTKDTCGTYEGYLGQRTDLADRGLTSLYDKYVARLFPAVAEMCSNGLPVSRERLSAVANAVRSELDAASAALHALPGAESLNPRSPGQVKAYLTGKGYAIPKKYDAATKSHKESTDEKSLKKLRMKHPEDPALSHLLTIRKLEKAQSSYLSFGYDADSRMRYSLTAGGTETMRMAGHCDPWDRGVNPQTVPGGSKGINIKAIYETLDPDFVLLSCDLAQAESRFVAYDAADLNLINALEDPSRDIHSEVAAEICRALGHDPAVEQEDAANWKKRWRQLGKKSGHGANYSMKEATFQDSCISERDLVLSRDEATKVLEAYHKLFPGIRRWHAEIRRELAQTRMLKTPWGWSRHFWGRLDDDMFRQAYAFRPQSTIPYIVNQLMLHLCESREQGVFDFKLLLQCHDSILLEVRREFVPAIAEVCRDTEKWHPDIRLPGGRLIIPTEVEVGRVWGEMTKWGKDEGTAARA